MHKSVTVTKRGSFKPSPAFPGSGFHKSPEVRSISGNSARKTSGKK